MTDPTEWAYASGIVAVLETFLLAPNTVGELAAAESASDELLARVRRNPVYAGVQVSDDPLGTAASLESALVGFLKSFAEECPDARIVDPLLIDYDLRDLAGILKSRHCGLERRPVPLSALPEGEIDELPPRLAELADQVSAAAAEAALSAFAVDLTMDAALIDMLPGLAAPLGSPLIDRWAAERSRFAAIEAVVRAKLSGIQPDDIHRHLLRREPVDSALAELADLDRDSIRRRLAELLPEELVHGLDPSAGASAARDLSARLDAELEKILDPAGWVTFGAERVFRYLWQLFRENRNLRAALGGAAAGVEPELVTQSLRGVHG